MLVPCPHCHNLIEIEQVAPREELTCTSCGSSFRMDGQTTTGWQRGSCEKLGRFELLLQVGDGAFGTVYKARDPELDREVAIKVPRAGSLGEGEQRERFFREARSVARLRHPAIVSVHEVGEAGGMPFLVSDFVDGMTLADFLTIRRPEPKIAAAIAADLAEALDYAHHQGVVHRDVKPSNVLLDASGRPHLTDFGLARRDAVEATLTAEGQVLGTPAYMSPEQAAGQAHQVDGRSDVYALGATLYHLLTGETPFRGNARAMLHQVLHEEPRPPRQLNDQVPRDLETVCVKAMAKEPARRYATAGAMAEDLRRFLAGEPVRARPAGVVERLVLRARRRPLVASLLAAIVLITALSLAVVTGLWLKADRAADDATREAAAARAAESVAEAARRQTLRTALEGQRSSADAFLSSAKVLRQAGGGEGLELIRKAVALRDQAARTLRELDDAELTARERSLWEARTVELRDEATRWLTEPVLRRVRSVPLPPRTPSATTFPAPTSSNHNPLVAVSPEGARVAAHYPGAHEALVLGGDGGVMAHLPLPEDVAPTPTSRHRDDPWELSFPAADRVEYETPAEVIAWSLPGGAASRRLRPPRKSETAPGAIRPAFPDLVGPRYIAAVLQTPDSLRLTVRPRDGARGETRVLWQSVRRGVAVPADAAPQRLRFGHSPELLYALLPGRLLVADAATGQSASAPLADAGLNASGLDLMPAPGGIATLEHVSTEAPNPPGKGLATVVGTSSLRVTFWEASLPPARRLTASHPLPVAALDRAADGLVLTGGEDHVLKAWKDGRLTWACGIASDATWTGAIADAALPPPSDGPYPWWGFLPGGQGPLVVERAELSADGTNRMRLEVFRAVDGRPLRSWSAAGDPRIVGRSRDRRFAVIASGPDGRTTALEAWSLEDDRPLGSLGRFPVEGDGSPALTAVFSPGSHWLLLLDHVGQEMEIWQVPELKKCGRVKLPTVQVSMTFDREDRRALLRERSHRGSAMDLLFARVIDLPTASVLCDLGGLHPADGAISPLRMTGQLVALTQTGNSMLGSAVGGQLVRWDLKTGARIDVGRTSFTASGVTARLSPDGTRLVLYGLAGYLFQPLVPTVELWDLANRKLLRQARLPVVPMPELAVLLRMGGTYLRLTADGTRVLWSVEGGPTRSWRWSDGTDAANDLGELHATDEAVGTALWRRPTGLVLRDMTAGTEAALEDSSGPWRYLGRGPDGTLLRMTEVKGGAKGEAAVVGRTALWQARTGRVALRVPDDQRWRSFDPSGRWVLAADAGTRRPRASVLDVQTGRVVHTLELPPFPGYDGFSDSWRGQSTLTSTDGTTGYPPLALARSSSLRLGPDGRRAVVLAQGTLQLWDIAEGKRIRIVDKPGHLTPVACVAQQAGANLAASGGEEGVVLLWDRRDGRFLRSLVGHTDGVTALAFAPDGRRLASADARGGVLLWGPDGERLAEYRDPHAGTAIRCLAYHPRGGLLVAGTADGRLLFLDGARLEVLASRPADGGAVQALAFAADGRLLTGTASGSVQLWRAEEYRAEQSWKAADGVTALAWVGDGLAAVGGTTVRLCEPATGRCVWALDVQRGPVRGLAAHDTNLAVADQTNLVLFVDLRALGEKLKELGLGLNEGT